MIRLLFRIILVVVLIVVLAAGGLIGYLTYTEFNPDETEPVTVSGDGTDLVLEDGLSILTFNIGYCGLSYDVDFVMDGGQLVRPDSKTIIERNLTGIMNLISVENTDVAFIQEIDRDSKRGYGVNSVEAFTNEFDGTDAFAQNFLCTYIPYPLPETIGMVDSGIMTLNKYRTIEATRYSLPTSFTWPVRVCQLKRCLLLERIPIEGSDKQLVLINLHLEAYDSGEGKIAQTKVLVDLLTEEYEKGNYCIAGGDFNQTFPGADESLYPVIDTEYFVPGTLESSLFPEGWTFAYDEAVPTSRLLNEPYDPESPNTQYYVIDGFILSPNVALETIETIDAGFEFSDHNPVKMKVSFKTQDDQISTN